MVNPSLENSKTSIQQVDSDWYIVTNGKSEERNQQQLLSQSEYGCKKSPTGPSEWTPKPENLIALQVATSLGVRW